jgi:hypothetical protein
MHGRAVRFLCFLRIFAAMNWTRNADPSPFVSFVSFVVPPQPLRHILVTLFPLPAAARPAYSRFPFMNYITPAHFPAEVLASSVPVVVNFYEAHCP